MDAKEIKFFVKRIFTKDLSLESPESPAIPLPLKKVVEQLLLLQFDLLHYLVII